MFFLLLEEAPGDNRNWRNFVTEIASALRPTNCCPIQPFPNPWPERKVAILLFVTVVLLFIMYFTGLFTGNLPLK